MPTILVLEDDPELNQTISSVLERESYRIFSAYSCKEAKEVAENYTLDMAVLDINLPDGDGFWFCRWLKARNQVPVLFLSARDLEEDMLKGYDLGAEDYLTKPFSIIPIKIKRYPKKKNY